VILIQSVTSIIEFGIYYPDDKVLSDPVLHEKDKLYDNLTDTDESSDPPYEKVVEWMNDDIFNDKIISNKEELLSSSTKDKLPFVFNESHYLRDYMPKYFINNETDQLTIEKQEAIEYAMNKNKYNTEEFDNEFSSEIILKVLKEIAFNPVWDSGMRISDWDKLDQIHCYCPLQITFNRCHKLFGNDVLLHDKFCPYNEHGFPDFPCEPSSLCDHLLDRNCHMHMAVYWYLKGLYGNHWGKELAHKAFHPLEEDQLAKTMEISSKVKGIGPYPISWKIRKYTREEKEKKLSKLDIYPERTYRNLEGCRSLTKKYNQEKLERMTRRKLRKERNFFQEPKKLSLMNIEVKPSDLLIFDQSDFISPMSATSELPGRFAITKCEKPTTSNSLLETNVEYMNRMKQKSVRKEVDETSHASNTSLKSETKPKNTIKIRGRSRSSSRSTRKEKEDHIIRKFKYNEKVRKEKEARAEELRLHKLNVKELIEQDDVMRNLIKHKKLKYDEETQNVRKQEETKELIQNSTFTLKSNVTSKTGRKYTILERFENDDSIMDTGSRNEQDMETIDDRDNTIDFIDESSSIPDDNDSSRSHKRKHKDERVQSSNKLVKGDMPRSRNDSNTKKTNKISVTGEVGDKEKEYFTPKQPQSKARTKRLRRQKQKRSKYIYNTLVKQKSIDEDLKYNVLKLFCTVRKKKYIGHIRQPILSEEETEASANIEPTVDNVVWNIYIADTPSYGILFSTSKVYDAIETNKRDELFHCVVYWNVEEPSKNKSSSSSYLSNSCFPNQIIISNNGSSSISSSIQSSTYSNEEFKKERKRLKTNKICRICNQVLPSETFISKVNMFISNRLSSFINRDEMYCPQCLENYIQLKKEEKANELLELTLSQTIPLYKLDWSNDDYVLINNKKILNRYLDSTCFDDDTTMNTLRKSKYIHVMKIKSSMSSNEYKKKINHLKGSSISTNFNDEIMDEHSISYPLNDIGGLIIFQQTNDFLFIDKVPNKVQDIIDFSMSETMSINNLTLNGRSGSAGGFVNVGSNSHSLSKVTQKDNSILVASRNGVAMSCIYDNDKNDTKKYNSVYNDLYMNRLDGKDKFNELKKNKSFRTITLNEMISRIQSFIIACQLKLNCKAYGNPFKSLNDVIKTHKSNKKVNFFLNKKYSLFESMLLAWSCRTGEMRNHMSVKAHTDGNSSHSIETLSLFARIPMLSQYTRESINKYFKDGYLYFPIDGLVVKYKVGRHIIHCSLKNTLHLADKSRNDKNWSKVTGP
jgi:hypothetical protein